MKEEIVLKLLEKLLDIDNSVDSDNSMNGKYVIIRCRDAGVHAGVLKYYKGREVHLKESRRLWYFNCKEGHTLSGVAIHGIADDSKIAGELEEIKLLDACEIIPCCKDAERSIRNAKEHNC